MDMQMYCKLQEVLAGGYICCTLKHDYHTIAHVTLINKFEFQFHTIMLIVYVMVAETTTFGKIYYRPL